MKLLIVAGPYEADRLRRAAAARGIDATVVEPGDSLSAWLAASRPDVILLAPKAVSPVPEVAVAKIRSNPAGHVPLFLLGDEEDRQRTAALGAGFFVRPLSPTFLMEQLLADADPSGAPEGEERGGADLHEARAPLTLRPLVAEGAGEEPRPPEPAAFPEPPTSAHLLGRLTRDIEATFDQEIAEALKGVESLRARAEGSPAPAEEEEKDADGVEEVADFIEEKAHKTVEAPDELVASMLVASGPDAPGERTSGRAEREPDGAPGAPEPAEQGSVEVQGVAGLIGAIYRHRTTGRLHLSSDGVEKSIAFDAGFPVLVTSNLPEDRMADMLQREGRISRDQHRRCAEVMVATGRRMGAVLVDLGFIKASELFSVVRRHYEEIFYSLFAWEAGTWALERGPQPEGERIRLVRNPAALILEGVRRKIDLPRLRALVGGPATVLALAGPSAADLAADAGLTANERRAFSFIDGRRALAEILAAGEVSDEELYRLAWGLIAVGAVTAVSGFPRLDRTRDVDIDRERVLSRYAIVTEGDYFQLLGIRRSSSGHEIRQAYESLRREFAPDRFDAAVAAELGPELAAIQEVLDEGMRILGDDRIRESYRAHLPD